MATYRKKAVKKSSAIDGEIDSEIEKKSTTAHIFKSLDTGASRIELWVQQYQKYVFSGIGLVLLAGLGWFLYQRFIQAPREEDALAKSFFAQQVFNEASSASGNRRDSLYLLALEGGKNLTGYLQLISDYKGTKTANVALYASGVAYLNLGKYQDAITQLEKFEAKDLMLGVVAKGSIGDAYVFLNKPKDALTYYDKAIKDGGSNALTTPRYLFKAALVAHKLGKKTEALSYLNRIKNEFPYADESRNIDVHIAHMNR